MSMVNRTNTQLKMSVLGKGMTSNEVDIYQILITTGDPLTLPSDNLSSGVFDMTTVNDRAGKIIGQTQGNEQEPQGEISFSFYEDFSHLGKKHVVGNQKNRLINLLNGQAFKVGSDTIIPIGTNGTDKNKNSQASYREMNKPYRYIYYNEGEFIFETGTCDMDNFGKMTLKKNPYKASFDRAHKTFCFEVLTTSSEGQICKTLAIMAKPSIEWAEGDINQFNCTAQRGCDVFERNDFLTDVYKTSSDTMAEANELYVDQIVVAGGTPPTSGTSGDLMLSIDSKGVPTIKKYDGSAWSEETSLQDLIKTGTRFKTKKLIDTQIKESNVFAVTDENKKCVDFSTNNSKRFYCLVKELDLKISGEYEDYITIEE